MKDNLYSLIKNQDGTMTLGIPEGICSIDDVFPYVENEQGYTTLRIPEELRPMFDVHVWHTLDEISVINIPASMECLTNMMCFFRNLKEICVHPENKYFTVEDGALFSKDKKKILKYFGKDNCHAYRIDDCVEEIAEGCFAEASGLKRIDIGKGVKKIGYRSLSSDGSVFLEKIYIPPTVTELCGEIFDSGGADSGMYYPVSIVGGAAGSVIEEYCNERGIDFIVVDANEVDDFYATSVDELRQRMQKQIANEKEFFVEDPENGYQAKFCDGVLAFQGTIVKNTRRKINAYRRKMVQKILIGDGITELAALAFDDYENLESVLIGADICKIHSCSFNGKNHSDSYGCRKLSSIVVDEKNPWYKAMDGVLYTHDMQTLVKYCPAKPELYYEVAPQVRHIGDYAFEYAGALQCLNLGTGCVSVGHAAFLNAEALRHVYVADSVTQWPERYPFVGEWGFDRPYCLDVIIGGKRDSFVQKYCADEGVHFHVIEDGQMQDFLNPPLPDKEDDPYVAACRKVMIVDRNGVLRQLGEVGEELILPEGVVRTLYRMDLSGCKKVVIPSTMTSLWTECFDGPAENLKAFVVDEQNPVYQSVNGHLYTLDGTLLTYAPAVEHSGVLPEGTVTIHKEAFRLLPSPFEKVYIPSSVEHIELGWQEWFYEAEVAQDNPWFKSIDGSIFSADGKKLVCAKISPDGYRVPDGTQIIGKNALRSVHGTVYIPESVTQIDNMYGLGRFITAIGTTKGSYARQYAEDHRLSVMFD